MTSQSLPSSGTGKADGGLGGVAVGSPDASVTPLTDTARWNLTAEQRAANEREVYRVLVPSWARTLRIRGAAVAMACIESFCSETGWAKVRELPEDWQ